MNPKREIDLGYFIAEATSDFQTVKIQKEKKNSIIFETTLQDFALNRNKRLYDKEVLTEALDAPHIIELVKRKSWYGEAGHPITTDMNRLKEVKQTNISHIILEKTVGTTVEGLIETANTSVGRDFMGLIDQGSKVAFSMRGFGKTVALRESPGSSVVTRPMKILTYDWVVFPSHASAVMKTIKESSSEISFKDSMVKLTESDVKSFLRENSDQYLILESFFAEMGYEEKSVRLESNRFVVERDGGSHILPLQKTLKESLYRMF